MMRGAWLGDLARRDRQSTRASRVAQLERSLAQRLAAGDHAAAALAAAWLADEEAA